MFKETEEGQTHYCPMCEEEHRAAQCMQRKLEKIQEWAKTADIDLASEVELNNILGV